MHFFADTSAHNSRSLPTAAAAQYALSMNKTCGCSLLVNARRQGKVTHTACMPRAHATCLASACHSLSLLQPLLMHHSITLPKPFKNKVHTQSSGAVRAAQHGSACPHDAAHTAAKRATQPAAPMRRRHTSQHCHLHGPKADENSWQRWRVGGGGGGATYSPIVASPITEN